MKKYIAFLLIACMTVTLCACHPSDYQETENTEDTKITEPPTDAPTVPPVDPTNPPTEPPTDPPKQPPTDPPTEPPTEPFTEPLTQPSYDAPVLTSDVEDLIKSAFIAASSEEYGKDELRVEYYGEYEGAYIAFVDGPWDNNGMDGSEIVAGVEFRYRSSSRKLKVYKDGEKLSLQEALDAGWLSETSIHELWGYYQFVND